MKDESELTGAGRQSTLASTPVFRAAVPRMHLWPTTTTAAPEPTPEFEWEQTFTYATPTARRQLPNFSGQETPERTIHGGFLDPQYDSCCTYEVSIC